MDDTTQKRQTIQMSFTFKVKPSILLAIFNLEVKS